MSNYKPLSERRRCEIWKISGGNRSEEQYSHGGERVFIVTDRCNSMDQSASISDGLFDERRNR